MGNGIWESSKIAYEFYYWTMSIHDIHVHCHLRVDIYRTFYLIYVLSK